MKQFKIIIALVACMFTFSVANAQTETPSDTVAVPESYMQTQDQLEENTSVVDTSMGAATYNIDDTAPAADPGAASFREEGEAEELRIYSGSHDGNNFVKTMQVKVPVKRDGPY